jgi:tungstate transport system ATP-binding protein
MSLVTIRGLRKSFGERLLFEIDNLTIEEASACVLTGANGTGKSTLLRVIAGLEAAQCESASFLGQVVNLGPYPQAMRDAVVYVHQHPVMFSTSVEENIAYGLHARGMAKPGIRERVEEAMAWAGVSHLRGRDPVVLSGGEKQRIALARAKVLQPKLLLLDEPTANLDGPAREQVIALIPALIADGRSVVMACHDRDLISLPGVQRMKLKDGRLVLRNRPRHKEHKEYKEHEGAGGPDILPIRFLG